MPARSLDLQAFAARDVPHQEQRPGFWSRMTPEAAGWDAACSASPTEINPQHRLSRSLISLAGLGSYSENLYPIWETHYSEQQQNREMTSGGPNLSRM